MKHFISVLFLTIILNIGLTESVKSQNGVGLVLCGGGAKGFAHIGVLKILDSLQVPVEYIGGTSVGAIIGSLYALGYSGNDIEQLVLNTDWGKLFSDEADRNLIPFFQKNLMERCVATFKINDEGIKLPEGFISGQNILNFFSDITLNAHSRNDFHQFKIPFFCIATDIGSGKDIVLEDGFLATALRASMSIPTAFSPFELNNRILIDGGIINNFPVDVMKERYSGTIIGVDIQKGMQSSQKIESITSVLNQLSTILDLNRFNSNKSLCDIYIHPDIQDYSTMSFTTEAVDSLIKRGEEAARKLIPELKKYSCDESYIKHHSYECQTVISTDTVFTVNEIFVKGQKRNSTQYIRQKLGIDTGKPFTLAQLRQGINSLYATNEYEYISYRFVSDDALQIFCKERIINSIGVGINYETGNNATVLLNYTHRNILFNGDLVSVDGKLSNLPGFKVLYVFDKGAIPAPLLLVQDNTLGFNFYTNKTHTGNALVNLGVVEVGVNATAKNLLSMGIAANAQLFSIYDVVNPAGTSVPITKSETEVYYNYKAYVTYDSRNSSILPTKGNRFYADIEAHTDNFLTYKQSPPMVSVMLHNERAYRLSKRFTLLFNEGVRMFLTDSLPHPMLKTFLGGDYQPDLYTYQFPFQGLRFAQVLSKNVVVFGAGLRYHVYKRHYVSFLPNIAAACDYFIFKDKTNYILGGGINYTYNSIFGPLQYTLSYSNQSKTLISFLSLGYRF